MKAYKTWFTNKWEIEEVETDDLRPLGRNGRKVNYEDNTQRNTRV